MQADIRIATRHYHDIIRETGEEYELQDRMIRKPCGSFVLMVAGELPGDPEVELAYSLEDVFGWYQDCPEQIERAVIKGDRPPSIAEQTGMTTQDASPWVFKADG